VLHFAKLLQALGFADVGLGLYVGVVYGDQWKELYMAVTGCALFWVGRPLEQRA